MNRRKQGRSKAGIVLILILLAAMSFGVGGFLGWLRSKEGFRDEAESIARVRLDEETPQVITNAQDALEVLTEEVKTAHGVNDAEEEYQLYTEMTAGDFRVYWFRQYWQGIAVDGSGFKVVTDADGLLQMINGKHIDAEDADTSFLVSEEQAKELVEEYLKETYQCGEKGAEIGAEHLRVQRNIRWEKAFSPEGGAGVSCNQRKSRFGLQ